MKFTAKEIVMCTKSKSYPDLMTGQELIEYLRMSEVSTSKNLKRSVQYLKSYKGLPRINIGRSTLYPLKAIREWLDKQTYTT